MKRLAVHFSSPIVAWLTFALAVAAFCTFGDSLAVYVAALILAWALWGTSLNIIWGYAGALSLAQMGFAAIGAFSVAVLCKDEQINFWLAVLVGMVLALALSVVVGYVTLNLRGFAFAVMTLITSLLIVVLLTSWEPAGRTTGVVVAASPGEITIGSWSLDLGSDKGLVILLAVANAVTLVLCGWLERTRAGRFVVALREDEPLAASLGVHPLKYRVLAFMLSAAVASLAGSLYALTLKFITPSLFSFHASVTLIACVVLGGLGFRFGPLVGAAVYIGLTQWLHVGGDYSDALSGALLIVIVLFAQMGILGLLKQGIDRLTGKQSAHQPDEKPTDDVKTQTGVMAHD
ncbi:branched-chain amino acid ABC transporter permease [Rhodococcus sp. NPDC059968]|uniref:branched-chain amino acid ABC transporter permease n=1 Tax=Rhodococcus sp. NPDC059968 TaxID=3347017 RepID=UPI003672AE4F